MTVSRRPFWLRVLAPVCVALASLNLLGLLVWTLPRGYRQRNAAARAEAARLEAERGRAEVAELRERADRVRANARDVTAFYQKQVGSDTTAFVEAVETMARVPGLRSGARSFNLQPVAEVPLVRESVTLPLGGSYQQLVGFLRQVEEWPGFITVDGVSMQSDAASGGTLQVQLSTYLKAGAGSYQGQIRGRRAR